MRNVTSLGSGTDEAWARSSIDAASLRETLCEARQDDAVDAEAICEAVTRPTMRFVAMKSAEQQAALSLHRTRNLLVKQRTQLVNMIRGLLAEVGMDIPEGLERALGLARQIAAKEATPDVPPMAISDYNHGFLSRR